MFVLLPGMVVVTVILVLGRLRKEDHKFEARLGYKATKKIQSQLGLHNEKLS
jgi:hypothetical protein